jgi:hypothetical protein
MTRSAMTALLGPEFDAFLFASVDEEGKGGLLSVVSALTRLDVDPWREAAELARMPREAANRRLTSLIAALPDTPAGRLAPATIAGRLVKLPPRGGSSSVASREKPLRTDPTPTPTSRTIANMILINLLVMAGMLCAQWALAGLQPRHVGTGHAAASGEVIPQTPQVGQLN